MVRCRWLSSSSAAAPGPLLLRECAFQAAFLLTVGNLPNCSRHRDKKWPVPYAKHVPDLFNCMIRILAGAVFFSEGIQKFLFSDTLGVGRFAKVGIPEP